MSAEPLENQGVVEQLPLSLQRLAMWERFHLHKVEQFQNTSLDPAFDARYLPQNCGAVRLPCFWVPRSAVHVFGRQQEETDEVRVFDSGSQRVLLPIHPAFLSRYLNFLSSVGAEDSAASGLLIWGIPTSSTRTFLAWPDGQPHRAAFLKTSLHSPIFGDRRIHLRIAARSVGLSRLMEASAPLLPRALGYLPERVAVVPRTMPDSGAIVRSIPLEICEGQHLIAPLFALLGGRDGRTPLLLTLLDRCDKEPLQFIEDVFCEEFARLWLQLTMQLGLILEAHAQDLLLELTPALTPTGRYYYRDFEGLQVDWELRTRCGLHSPAHMPRSSSWSDTYDTWGYRYGQLIWYKLGTSLLQYIHLVLNEIEGMLVRWQQDGILGGHKITKDDITMLWSRHMLRAISDMVGIRVPDYNVQHSMNRFLILLMKVRRIVIAGGRDPSTRPHSQSPLG